VAAEEGISSQIIYGGERRRRRLPVGGKSFGAVQKAWCVVDALSSSISMGAAGTDVTYLGLAQTNRKGVVTSASSGPGHAAAASRHLAE
jgi:acyl CoA:acetate/3-ketoacid CoA transferase